MVSLQWFIIFSTIALSGCFSSNRAAYDDYISGTISYPFLGTTKSLGNNGADRNKFVIRTISGSVEHVVEIPGAATEYDVEVPIASGSSLDEKKYKIKNAQLTDRELVSNMPKLSKATESERLLMDKAFGVGQKGGPRQGPSYSLGIAKINELYKRAKYELGLVELNNLLAYYPTSVKLFKMKGSIYLKLRNLTLAEKAWTRAAELAPRDPVIKKGLKRLRRRIEANNQLAKSLDTADPAKQAY